MNCEFYVYLFHSKRPSTERVIRDIIIYVLRPIAGKIYACLRNRCDRTKDRLGEREGGIYGGKNIIWGGGAHEHFLRVQLDYLGTKLAIRKHVYLCSVVI